jgi:hypothetical protein
MNFSWGTSWSDSYFVKTVALRIWSKIGPEAQESGGQEVNQVRANGALLQASGMERSGQIEAVFWRRN